MSEHDTTHPADLAALRREYGDRWQVEHDHELDVWSALHRSRDGRHVRVLVAHDAGSLRSKIVNSGEAEDAGE